MTGPPDLWLLFLACHYFRRTLENADCSGIAALSKIQHGSSPAQCFASRGETKAQTLEAELDLSNGTVTANPRFMFKKPGGA